MAYPENIMGVLALFIAEMGPTELSSMGCMLNLPKSKTFYKIIYRWQTVLCK